MRRLLVTTLAALTLAGPALASTPADQVLDNVQQAAFNYMWNEANSSTGLIRDRNQSGSPSSIAAVGFGLSAICVGIDHGWVTRAQGATRVYNTLNTFWTQPQGPAPSGTIGYKGFFYHFLDLGTAVRMPGWNPELSDIDTALLLAGVLDCEQYFNTGDPTEVSIRSLADQIYRRVDWTFFQNTTQNGLMHQWLPDAVGGPGTFDTGVWTGYNEMMIMYILAMGSPTHSVPAADWSTYTSTYNWTLPTGGYGGVQYLVFPPLYGHQYSHCWINFKNKRDPFMNTKGSDYFTNSRRAVIAQQAYCIANPGIKPPGAPTQPDAAGYSSILWGLTAGDGPTGYTARGAPGPGFGFTDDGTIAPTAVVASLPFAPEICVPTIVNMYDNYPLLWGTYGFRDGFNLGRSPDWYDNDFLGIDQGPMVLMIENYRNASIWLRFMQNPYVIAGMNAAGFVNTVGVTEPPAAVSKLELRAGPNPFSNRASITYRLPDSGRVRLTVHDVAGREVAHLVDEWQAAGEHVAHFDAGNLPNGVYWYRLATPGAGVVQGRGVLMR